jgi:hypothetical protein
MRRFVAIYGQRAEMPTYRIQIWSVLEIKHTLLMVANLIIYNKKT